MNNQLDRDECPHWGAWECRCPGPKCGYACVPKLRYKVLVISQDKLKNNFVAISISIWERLQMNANIIEFSDSDLQRNYFKLIN